QLHDRGRRRGRPTPQLTGQGHRRNRRQENADNDPQRQQISTGHGLSPLKLVRGYNGGDNAASAQTERPGAARPVRDLLGGGSSPATCLHYLQPLWCRCSAPQPMSAPCADSEVLWTFSFWKVHPQSQAKDATRRAKSLNAFLADPRSAWDWVT